ncbi:tetraacyldisaccharide 4'-kinase [Pedobacter changchengzhani]|uniref:Tetraacyldisaccharide 4'-kinase n=1 Tax=Pedobacter changchengzhani TaxID=2529274 RepID=A0A4R5MIA6_9SPHI|nr:tetraacyldisaccharide 4'-kinase [Pedobacter changchengzhani]TDG35251.1 tetraacyldisaccharide 4'-kinase [Pedobacter changchengzhani]
MLKYLRLLLFPFSFVYGFVIVIRNKFYDWHIFNSVEFDLPIICVGNLAVGGSGKTPTTEYLVRLLSNYKVAILSRGYGRKTKGFILADENATAESIGDEPLQYFQKFKNVTAAVCEDRVAGIRQLKTTHDLIILDDAFQHRAVSAGLNILLFEFQKLREFQLMLPAGNLRDVFSSRKRADVLMVTKSPIPITEQAEQESVKKLKPLPNQQVVHSFLKYDNLQHIFKDESIELASIKGFEIFLLTGIANPKPLLNHLRTYSESINHHKFADHYVFSRNDIEQLKSNFNQSKFLQKIIITTEKDSKRLKINEFEDLLLNLPTYYLPIEVDLFEKDKVIFNELILKYVNSYRRNR